MRRTRDLSADRRAAEDRVQGQADNCSLTTDNLQSNKCLFRVWRKKHFRQKRVHWK